MSNRCKVSLAIVMFINLVGVSCVSTPLAPRDFNFTEVVLKGPNGETLKPSNETNQVGPDSTVMVEFTIQRRIDLGGFPLIVTLNEEPTGSNTGGLFSWASVPIPAGAANTSQTASTPLVLRCNGKSIEGNAKVGPDGKTPNNPDSGLGTRDLLGNLQPAHVHASIAGANSNTALFVCAQ